MNGGSDPYKPDPYKPDPYKPDPYKPFLKDCNENFQIHICKLL